jgi:hypothetical protein
MERGIPMITVYTFEVPQGQEMHYPDAELWTLDFREADAFAQKNKYLLMGMEWGEDAPVLEADYTPKPPKPECRYCGIGVEKQDTGIWEDTSYVPSSDHARYCDESPDHQHHVETP